MRVAAARVATWRVARLRAARVAAEARNEAEAGAFGTLKPPKATPLASVGANSPRLMR